MLKRILTRLRSERGDTLIEVTFALGIMATVLVSSTLIATKAFQLGTTARYRTQLVNAAVEQAEALRSYRDNIGAWSTFESRIIGAATAACTLPSENTLNDCFAMITSGGAWTPTNNPTLAAASYPTGSIPSKTVIETRLLGIDGCIARFEVHYGSPSIINVGALNYNEGEITVNLVDEQYIGLPSNYTASCQP